MSDDIKTMRQVIAASIGRHYGAAPASALLKAQEGIGKAVSEACRAVLNNIDQGIIKEGAARRIAQTLAWAGAELVAHEWNDGHPDRGEAHELRGLWRANDRLRSDNQRLRERIALYALKDEERINKLLLEQWAGLNAKIEELTQERAKRAESGIRGVVVGLKRRAVELERECVSLQEGAKKSAEHIAKLEETLARAKRYVPQGDCDQITIRKADQIMERDGLVPSGLILLNPRSGQRAYLEAGCVRWLDQDAGYFFMRPDRDQDSRLVSVGLAARPSSAAEIEGLDRELKQELAEWSKLRKLVPSGPAGAINCRKAEKLLEQPHMRATGIVLANTETNDRTIIDMSAVRWMESEEFQKLMHPKWAPVTAIPTSAQEPPEGALAERQPDAIVSEMLRTLRALAGEFEWNFPGEPEPRELVEARAVISKATGLAASFDKLQSFALRFLDPEDLGYAVNEPVRDSAREALGIQRVIQNLPSATPCQGHAAQQEREEGGAA